MIASDNRHDSQSISYSHVMQTALKLAGLYIVGKITLNVRKHQLKTGTETGNLWQQTTEM